MNTSHRPQQNEHQRLPRLDRWLVDGFEKHSLPRYLRRHFHSLQVDTANLDGHDIERNSSLVVYANHASWWDPMLAFTMRRQLFPRHRLYAPIDARALERYRIFKRMGFYGIELNSHQGAAEFLRRSLDILCERDRSIWMTPEGRFSDVRQLDLPLMPGLAHLAYSIGRQPPTEAHSIAHVNVKSQTLPSQCVWFVPAAVEYVFWEHRLPECLCRFGLPVQVKWGEPQHDKLQWSRLLTEGLRNAQRELAVISMARDTSVLKRLL